MINRGPLSGTFVLDLSRILAGPTATQILGDLGADVVKVERPGAGDDTRYWGPPFASDARDDSQRGDAAYFLGTNRNKRSITVDIADPRGAEVIRSLAAQADVLVENFKMGSLARYGLDYASLSAINPRLVYCSITGFGHSGPSGERPGYDFVMQAMGGLMSITGSPDGSPGAEPMKTGVAVTDLFTGVYASTAILAALMEARTSGVGQHIDMALFDVQVSMLANQASSYLLTGEAPGRLGNMHPSLAPYELLPTASDPIVIAVGNDRQFRHLCAVLDVPALAQDARFADNASRVENRAALVVGLVRALATRDADYWIDAIDAAGVPCGPVNRIDQVFADQQAKARKLVVEQRRADIVQPVRSVASPIRLSRTPVRYERPPPALGEHSRQVLGERLGLSSETLDRLKEDGII